MDKNEKMVIKFVSIGLLLGILIGGLFVWNDRISYESALSACGSCPRVDPSIGITYSITWDINGYHCYCAK